MRHSERRPSEEHLDLLRKTSGLAQGHSRSCTCFQEKQQIECKFTVVLLAFSFVHLCNYCDLAIRHQKQPSRSKEMRERSDRKATSLANTAKLYTKGVQQRRPARSRSCPLFPDFSSLASSLQAVFRLFRQDTPSQSYPTNPDTPSIPTSAICCSTLSFPCTKTGLRQTEITEGGSRTV
ncbi:uncharacterized protein MKK02DRAFT_29446 [Dioszegia hungarica]|uniref:Uncharacterized protein n=1 Tax=Dioszegia hungarica TaxID=4972 RepID=A0AA38HFR6_9TREE|nr:uncharacterized protein MKK02DRAFT_29446 [Dioszegia hungarica]KAI9639367.1 hypothetical protein MKK02DRAFT_29446 [Dioszegia hungarica]